MLIMPVMIAMAISSSKIINVSALMAIIIPAQSPAQGVSITVIPVKMEQVVIHVIKNILMMEVPALPAHLIVRHAQVPPFVASAKTDMIL